MKSLMVKAPQALYKNLAKDFLDSGYDPDDDEIIVDFARYCGIWGIEVDDKQLKKSIQKALERV